MQLERDDVIDFVCGWLNCKREKISLNTRIGEDLGIDGDDAEEFLEEYSRKFSVDISHFPIDDYFGPEASFNPFSLLVHRINSKLKTLYIQDLVDGAERREMRQ